ncbi:hypothetical protein MIND_00164000 [Mycena indigotica]|uniref:Uncharacterized protein n=1 Tax=Mycena indigotica TaxID=2126181 RepID=A0A8H6TIP5_9AGAR|nr:uncharacterized protein MIND_00164000 [Mycena indigotica]KAF7316450.1 hypothetical protein MIND_00164000 [Mycena indigotica]
MLSVIGIHSTAPTPPSMSCSKSASSITSLDIPGTWKVSYDSEETTWTSLVKSFYQSQMMPAWFSYNHVAVNEPIADTTSPAIEPVLDIKANGNGRPILATRPPVSIPIPPLMEPSPCEPYIPELPKALDWDLDLAMPLDYRPTRFQPSLRIAVLTHQAILAQERADEAEARAFWKAQRKAAEDEKWRLIGIKMDLLVPKRLTMMQRFKRRLARI